MKKISIIIFLIIIVVFVTGCGNKKYVAPPVNFFQTLEKAEILDLSDYNDIITSFKFRLSLANLKKQPESKETFIQEMDLTISLVKEFHLDKDSPLQDLPNEVIIAQSIIETGYGTSKASQKKNNFFGLSRKDGKKLQIFDSMEASVINYFKNLGGKKAYAPLRAELKKRNKMSEKKVVTLIASVYAVDEEYQEKVFRAIKMVRNS